MIEVDPTRTRWIALAIDVGGSLLLVRWLGGELGVLVFVGLSFGLTELGSLALRLGIARLSCPTVPVPSPLPTSRDAYVPEFKCGCGKPATHHRITTACDECGPTARGERIPTVGFPPPPPRPRLPP